MVKLMKKNKTKHEITTTYKKLKTFLEKNIFNSRNKLIIIALFLLVLAGDIFLIQINSDLNFFGLSALLIILSYFYKLPSRYTFILCLALLIIMYILFLTQGTSKQTEKVAVWIVLFMAVGIAQQWFENEKK